MMQANQKSVMTGSQAVIQALLAEGVDHIFGISGLEILELLDAIYQAPGIRFITTRHEQGASFMAYGFARAAGTPGVCISTTGPGAVNLIAGVAAAYKGSVPVMALTGCAERLEHERDKFQDIDQIGLFTPVTKWSYMPTEGYLIPGAMRKAFRLMLTHPHGPVHVALPKDLHRQQIEAPTLAPHQYRSSARAQGEPDAAKRIAELLLGAESPVIVAGRDVLADGATGKLSALVNAIGVPVVTTIDCLDAFPTDLPLSAGRIGVFGWDSANILIRKADLILVLGAHLDFLSTSFTAGVIPKGARIVHVARNWQRIGAVFPVETGVVCDVGCFIEALEREFAAKGANRQEKSAAEEDSLRVQLECWEAKRKKAANPEAGTLNGQYVIRAVQSAMDRDAIVTGDAGRYMRFLRSHLDAFSPDSFIDTENWGAIGSAFPVALGAKLARPRRQVVCFSGDGGFAMNMVELETAVRENVPVISVVFSDGAFGSIRQAQRAEYAGRLIGSEFGHLDFAAFARNIGAYGERVSEMGEIEGAFKRAAQSGKPAVLDVALEQ